MGEKISDKDFVTDQETIFSILSRIENIIDNDYNWKQYYNNPVRLIDQTLGQEFGDKVLENITGKIIYDDFMRVTIDDEFFKDHHNESIRQFPYFVNLMRTKFDKDILYNSADLTMFIPKIDSDKDITIYNGVSPYFISPNNKDKALYVEIINQGVIELETYWIRAISTSVRFVHLVEDDHNKRLEDAKRKEQAIELANLTGYELKEKIIN